jgi:hypothetical protein
MPTCALCPTSENLETHHVTPRCRGGGDGETWVLCHDCHVRLHAEAGHYAAWGLAGAQAVLARYGEEGRAFLQEIGARGGRAVLARYGIEHLRALGRRVGRVPDGVGGHPRRQPRPLRAAGGRPSPLSPGRLRRPPPLPSPEFGRGERGPADMGRDLRDV